MVFKSHNFTLIEMEGEREREKEKGSKKRHKNLFLYEKMDERNRRGTTNNKTSYILIYTFIILHESKQHKR